jgi:beta-glucosidase
MSTPLSSFPAPYLDPARNVEERTEDLLDRMTLEEKLAQLGSAWVFQFMSGDQFSPERASELTRHGLGQVTRVAGASSFDAEGAARIANQIQRTLVEETRLGIPAIVHEEICSGVMARGSTIYPQAIGVAATFEPDLNRQMAETMRVQMRKMGAHQGLSPVLDVTRDARWGRSEETYGEDPYLVARMGTAFVRGLQGEDLGTGVIATAKHFVGYGASEGGMNWAPAHIGDRELREVYLHPFEAAVKEGRLRSVMNAYHEIDGIPCTANGHLLNGVLRDEWGFDGIVVSDYFAVNQLAVYHRLAATRSEAAAIALEAGIDSELPSTDCYSNPLAEALEEGRIPIAVIDEAVRRMLRLKLELGLFENPYVDETEAATHVDTTEQRELAAQIARKSMVLLSNDGTLPLDPSVGSIAVIGPSADTPRHMLGDYSYPAHIESLVAMRDRHNVFEIPIPDDVSFTAGRVPGTSVLEELKARFGDRVRHARGCGINDDDTSGFAEAVELAAQSDVVILVVGDKAGLTVDCTSGEGRDRSSLDLPGVQEDLARALIETGTPVVTVLVVGRPCGSEYLHQTSAAVLLAWLPGQEGGRAIADVLSGSYNPAGKLPMAHPRNAGQVPVFYGHKVSGGRSHWQGDYVDGPSAPLYPFGHGLTYTGFAVTKAHVTEGRLGAGDTVGVSVSVRNVGSVAGEEVVQLYIRDTEASVTRPVLELKAFERVPVDAGEEKTIEFEIPVGQLGFYDRDLRYVVEEGEIEFLVGFSSADLMSAGSVHVEAIGPIPKVFDGKRSVSASGTKVG